MCVFIECQEALLLAKKNGIRYTHRDHGEMTNEMRKTINRFHSRK